MKCFTKYFIATLIAVVLFELLFFIHRKLEYDLALDIDAVDAITIWATVLTIVFLVFSVLGLLNIDGRIKELNEQRDELRKLNDEMKEALRSIKESATDERMKIVDQAEKEIKNIINKSTERQNLYDRLTKIANTLDPAGRVTLYTEFLQENPKAEGINYAYVYICRGEAYLDLQKLPEALNDFEMAKTLTPNDFAPYVSLGIYYTKVKDFPKSIEMFEIACKLKPRQSFIYTNIANSYAAIHDYDTAKKYYDRALDFNTDNADYYYNKAKHSFDTKEDAEGRIAENYYRKALALNPTMLNARINIASIYRERKDNIAARNELDIAIGFGVHQDYIMALIQRGICSRLLGENASALIDFEHAYCFDPHNVQNLTNLAIVHLNVGEATKALEFVKKGKEEADKQNIHTCDTDLEKIETLAQQLVEELKKGIGIQINSMPKQHEESGSKQ